jgi:transposase
MLCGTSPIPASSGKTTRHRLNRGGDRRANSALHMIVVCRMRLHQRTKDYVTPRLAEGNSKRKITRCLNRYPARETYRALTTPNAP